MEQKISRIYGLYEGRGSPFYAPVEYNDKKDPHGLPEIFVYSIKPKPVYLAVLKYWTGEKRKKDSKQRKGGSYENRKTQADMPQAQQAKGLLDSISTGG